MISRLPAIERVAVSACTVPTDAPEADGTLDWDSTTIVIVEVSAGGEAGIGYTYGAAAAAGVVRDHLRPLVEGADAADIVRTWLRMAAAVRNLGRPGICATAIAAVDSALWDLKARLLGIPLAILLGRARDEVPVYGSGGFLTYSPARLRDQIAAHVEDLGCRWVKLKIGRGRRADIAAVVAARDAAGSAALMVDANGAYGRKEALALADELGGLGIVWFEEPVSSDDIGGLRHLRDRAPMDVAAGEYAYVEADIRRLLDAGAVDVLQLDATRISGITGFLGAAAAAACAGVPVSAHTAAALHLAPCLAVAGLRHAEWFHDHARLEPMLFDGVPRPRNGALAPDLTRPGNGLSLKRQDIARFAA